MYYTWQRCRCIPKVHRCWWKDYLQRHKKPLGHVQRCPCSNPWWRNTQQRDRLHKRPSPACRGATNNSTINIARSGAARAGNAFFQEASKSWSATLHLSLWENEYKEWGHFGACKAGFQYSASSVLWGAEGSYSVSDSLWRNLLVYWQNFTFFPSVQFISSLSSKSRHNPWNSFHIISHTITIWVLRSFAGGGKDCNYKTIWASHETGWWRCTFGC